MNLLKITDYIGNATDDLTVYFHIVESTLVVEALRNDYVEMPNLNTLCSICDTPIQLNKNCTIAEKSKTNVTIDIPASPPFDRTQSSDKSDAAVYTSTVELFHLANKNIMSDDAGGHERLFNLVDKNT
ncbi:hypothetical protein BC937DRAFT_94188 [Endogone sp. FLAS-F59071]|nr:hypothetical protein BC937DRAFT_94188 [Endogone sp. FLAS-F59071]|eukprot:RUS14203.1 hypothetical protein BC937DRAFT_94188 [Endogone sp. FLAS-F59071]